MILLGSNPSFGVAVSTQIITLAAGNYVLEGISAYLGQVILTGAAGGVFFSVLSPAATGTFYLAQSLHFDGAGTYDPNDVLNFTWAGGLILPRGQSLSVNLGIPAAITSVTGGCFLYGQSLP